MGQLSLAAHLSTALVADGGFSVDPRTGLSVPAGYAVAVHPEHGRILDGAVSHGDLRDFIAQVRNVLSVPGRILGGWRDPATGRVHLDVSLVTAELPDALAIARTGGQLAVFDLAGARSCPV